jgi:hypothetical protein
MHEFVPYLALAVSIVGSIIAWLVADARGKGRADVQAKALDALTAQSTANATKVAELMTSTSAMAASLAALTSTMQAQVSGLASVQVELGRSSQDRTALHMEVTRLDAQKANRDAVDGIRTMIVDLKGDIDRRFDDLTARVDRAIGGR